MIIIHIAHISDDPFGGVNVVAPQHVIAHQQITDTAFINLTNLQIKGIENQLTYIEPFSLSDLPEPFNKPDLVIFHETYRPAFLQIYKILLREKIPYIVIPHGSLTRSAQNKKKLKKRIANKLLFNRFFNNAESIQCLSERELKETNFGMHKFIGTNGINIVDSKKIFSVSTIQFTYIGRLDPYIKGLDLLIEAIKLEQYFLRDNHCKFSLYGPDEKFRKELHLMISEYKIEDLVQVHEPVEGAQKRVILLSTDCFVQTSRTEGMSMGILEALSYGIPSILTNGTGMAGLLQKYNAGWPCANDASCIAKAIRLAVIERKTFPDKSKNAINLITENFNWQKIAHETLKTYSKLIE